MPAKKSHPVALTVFGASGDLAKLKLFPALYAMALSGRLHPDTIIIGFARTPMSDRAFRALVKESILAYTDRKKDEKQIQRLLDRMVYVQGNYSVANDFALLKKTIEKKSKKTLPLVAYFSVPPAAFLDILTHLAQTRRSKQEDIRLVIEKPFGQDRASAEKLFHAISKFFREDQCYILDHYLGKSSVQSILNMRYANIILSNLLNGSEIANIQITAFEQAGVGHRLGYFDQVGLTKDMIQSHLLQVLALLIMSIPCRKETKSLQREKNNIIETIEIPSDGVNVVLGQYHGYKKEVQNPKSKTETFVAVRFFLDRQQWNSVPIYVRAGKKLHKKHTYAVIELKKFPFQRAYETPNRIIIELFPNPSVTITLTNLVEETKKYQILKLTDTIACDIEGCLPEHAVLLNEIMSKERTHFLSFAEVLAAWDVVTDIEHHIQKKHVPVQPYTRGTHGPTAQGTLTRKDGFDWFDPHA